MAYSVRDYIESYEMMLARVHTLHARLRDELIPRVAGLATAPLGLVLPPSVTASIRATLQSALGTLRYIESRVELHLRSGPLPIRLHMNADAWTSVSSAASGMAGDLRWENRPVPARWRGLAADTYEQRVVPGQIAAATELGAAAEAIANALNWVAMSIMVFFAGLLALLVQLWAIGAGAFFTFASGVGIPAALTALGASIPMIAIQISGLGGIAAEGYGRAQVFLADMRAKVLDGSTFPNGRWPYPEPARYNDATVSDGDPSDWVVIR